MNDKIYFPPDETMYEVLKENCLAEYYSAEPGKVRIMLYTYALWSWLYPRLMVRDFLDLTEKYNIDPESKLTIQITKQYINLHKFYPDNSREVSIIYFPDPKKEFSNGSLSGKLTFIPRGEYKR